MDVENLQSNNKPVIALIDDEERIVSALNRVFKQQYTVLATTDPDTYLDFFRDHFIHVAISDQRMPKRTGVDLLKQVKEISPYTIRILLTGYADIAAILDSVNEGEIYRYITKPWNIEEIRQTVARAAEISTVVAKDADLLKTVPASVNNSEHQAQLMVLAETVEDFNRIQSMVSGNYDLLHAATVDEAYEIIQKNEPAVLIADVRFNEVNISTVLNVLKEYAPAITVILLSDVADVQTLINIVNQAQVFRYLPRSVNQVILEVSIQRAIAQHQKLKISTGFQMAHEVQITPDIIEETLTLKDRLRGVVSRFKSLFQSTSQRRS